MTGFKVYPAQVAQSAKEFGTSQGSLSQTWSDLTAALQAQAGMAGDDHFAQTFFRQYQRGGDAVWAGFARAIDTVGGISRGLAQAANNHLKADHHSTVGASGSPPTVAASGSGASAVCILPIDTALGPGTSSLPGPLARFWPNADTGKLRNAAAAWRSAGESVEEIAGHLNVIVGSITDHNDGADIKAMEACWSRVYRIGDPHTILAGLPQLCKALAYACDRYADTVDSARTKMKWALAGAGIAIGITTIIGAAATITRWAARTPQPEARTQPKQQLSSARKLRRREQRSAPTRPPRSRTTS